MKNPVTRWYAEKEHVEEMPGYSGSRRPEC